MKEYALVYRNELKAGPQLTTEQAAAMMQRWMDWMKQLQTKGQLVSQGYRLEPFAGKVVKPNNVVTNGPYAEIKEAIGGFSIVKAESYDAAVEMAQGCPILTAGGNVEVREIGSMS